MKLVDFLFESAREIQNGDIDNFNQLHQKAKHETERYATTDPGVKGLYARIHKGWMFQLALIFALPFFQTYLLSYKQKMLNGTLGLPNDEEFEDEEFDEFDDEDEKEALRTLLRKYPNVR